MKEYSVIRTGPSKGGHIQGIALDETGEYVYCSYTTELIKYHVSGRRVGSVKGLTGHLGCLCRTPDGRIAGSLEYKNDMIGRGILQNLGIEMQQPDQFYAVFFDGDRITRDDMDAADDGIMTAVCLPEVARDYAAGRCGCSGIDGITVAPLPGLPEGEKFLTVAVAMYGDTARTDNDYQLLHAYSFADLAAFAAPLNPEKMAAEGPEPRSRFYVYTGNTAFGVQNLEYEADTGRMYMAVYRGKKEQFPNYAMYVADWNAPAAPEMLRGFDGEQGLVVPLWQAGCHHEASGVWGWEYPYGSTGMIALGGGKWLFSHNKKTEAGHESDIIPARFTGIAPDGWE